MPTTTLAAAVVRASTGEARALGSTVVGQEHVLIALAAHPDSVAGQAFAAIGLSPERIRDGITALAHPTGRETDPAPTPRLRAALEHADAEARERARPTVSSDLVLGMLRAHVGVGFQLLSYSRVTEAAYRDAVDSIIAGHPELADVEDVDAAALL